ncbi:MAG TPA: UDP-N-acetylmuramoyl-L-alanyl-D-glutamate--2,6-diaminopimelate ligase [Catalimonadaceae bacterium]|nr:UDP-N-acetylmuramoyl-L-alanyl-D-glutamate--2,6-diaminopimelate ligase [Catalimonadaceae bacterium]
MTMLKDILKSVAVESVVGSLETIVNGIAFDSRKVEPGFAFVAIKGTQTDGHEYIPQVLAKGCQTIIFEKYSGEIPTGVTAIQVENSSEALGQIACNWYDHPSRKLKLVAVTGTNGKTTISTLLHSLFSELGYRCGLISTVENKIGMEVSPSTHTTPDALSINELLAKMVSAGCSHVFMEASSHAIDQRRIAGLDIDGAIFSNISHDHLDYHITFENYIEAKKKLFDDLSSEAFSLVNVDDRRARVMVQNTKSRVSTFSLQTGANFKGKILGNTVQGLHMEINGKEVWFQLVGDFNAANLLAVFGAASLLGEDEEEILLTLSALKPVRGRFERLVLANRSIAIIDYAHTPDALNNVLETIKSMQTDGEQLITVVGCGGNRDRTKRPKMANTAAKMSTQVILTSDNPRNEDPKTIIMEMMEGVPISARRKVAIVEDRELAIREALSLAKPGDVVLIAGKGHETYQEIQGVKYPFDDREKVLENQNLITT